MISKHIANIISKSHTGTLTIPANQHRSYLFIIMTGGAGTVTLGGGDGAIPIGDGGTFEPLVCPSGEIVITAVGTFVVAMG